ncbi:MAG: GAF domain-containing protein [Magnetococcales bacterium]|nr:GAF domain-containing protein [Magnetococcales bacterium]
MESERRAFQARLAESSTRPPAPDGIHSPPTETRPENAQTKQIQHLELLLGLSRRMASQETLDQMLATTVELATTHTGAERGTLFLIDQATQELYSRVAQGDMAREIRIPMNHGIAGHVFSTGMGVIIPDAYADPRFDRSVDQETGFITRSILCAPVRTASGVLIGVIQVLNKRKGEFTDQDLHYLESLTTQAAITLQSAQMVERMRHNQTREREFLDVVADVTSDLELSSLLAKVIHQATRMLNAERSTLFLNDDKSQELWSEVGEGLDKATIRFPNHLGIAGAVFTTGKTINIPIAYADLRFNPAFDRKTGFFTRSILCVPVINKQGRIIGVTQVLNKRSGPFTEDDEARLKAFNSQISIGLENATLFNDIQNIKNYNESMLESMTNGVVTLDDKRTIITCNAAGLRILNIAAHEIVQQPAEQFFSGANSWILERLQRVDENQTSDITMDAELHFGDNRISVNVTIVPLTSVENKRLGSMLVFEDISNEKRIKSTMARYMDPTLADQLLDDGAAMLGGQSRMATVVFTDIRGFTTLSEELGPQGTVRLLNDYFTIMVECIQKEGGMLDKFIGDAIMAAFGLPLPHEDDEDRAVRMAIHMLQELAQWNRRRREENKQEVEIGIGINTDLVVSGNIGSPKRMDYTVIGDGVNLAARLESACKEYHARILISDHTRQRLKGSFQTRYVDDLVVQGKTRPVGVHEVLDYHTEESFPNMERVLTWFAAGRRAYVQGAWDEAISAFQEAVHLHPKDRLSTTYIERCLTLRDLPVDPGWNGVWVMKKK